MIALNPAVWMIRRPDGSATPFDAAKLKTEILEAFFLSGSPQESWIADEMAAGVEFSLSQLPKERRGEITEREIRELVAQLFAQTGFQSAGQLYIQLQTPSAQDAPGSVKRLHDILSAHFQEWSGERIRTLTEKVYAIIHQAGILCPTRELIIELAANLFHQKPSVSDIHAPLAIPSLQIEADNPLITAEAMTAILPPYLIRSVQNGLITLLPVSRVFPVLTLRIDWSALIHHANIKFPVTELIIMTLLPSLADTITDLYTACAAFVASENPLPLVIEFTGSERFSRRGLVAGWPLPGESICLQLARDTAAMVSPPPYKVILT